MEVALEMEDDLFFADLSKQISLLIMEEEDHVIMEEVPVPPYWNYSSSLQGFSRAVNSPAALSPASAYEQVYCRREISKGTGVFIPKSSQPRRKNRQGRFSSSSSSSPSSRRSHGNSSDHHQYCNSLTRPGPSQFSHNHKSPFHPKKF